MLVRYRRVAARPAAKGRRAAGNPVAGPRDQPLPESESRDAKLDDFLIADDSPRAVLWLLD
jgi:hypothetical protein